MMPLAGMTEGGMQIGRPDENAVDALNRCNRLEVVEGLRGLNLQQHAQLTLDHLRIIFDAPVARGSCRAAHAAHALGRIAGVGHRFACLLGCVDHRNQHGLGADVEHPLEHHHVVPGHPHHCLSRIGRHRLQLGMDRLEVVGRVLHVEQDPVEAGTCDQLDGEMR